MVVNRITLALVISTYCIFLFVASPSKVSGNHISSPTPISTLSLTSLIVYGPEYFVEQSSKRATETSEAKMAKYKDVVAGMQNDKIAIPVVIYHYIERYVDPADTIKKKLTVFLPDFEYQLMSWKNSGYATYFARDISKFLKEQNSPDSRSVVLTFDDGYEDFYTYVFPLLKKYEMKATVYVISQYIGRQGFLTSDQIRELTRSGLVEVGGHTRHHVYLKGMDKGVANVEVSLGKKELEDIVGDKIETFAYPFGAFSADAQNAVREASYSAAFTTMPGIVHGSSEAYLLDRIRPHQIDYFDIDGSLVRLYEQYK